METDGMPFEPIEFGDHTIVDKVITVAQKDPASPVPDEPSSLLTWEHEGGSMESEVKEGFDN